MDIIYRVEVFWKKIKKNRKLSVLLKPLSLIYRILWGLKYYAYERGILPGFACDNYVLSIGNLTTGGTGKTPLVQFILENFKRDYNFTVLNRNYRGRVTNEPLLLWNKVDCGHSLKDFNDEIRWIYENYPDIPVLAGRNRAKSAIWDQEFLDSDVLLLDDGFSTYNLEKDLNILCLDSTDEICDIRLLPAGKGREPWYRLFQADAIILQKTNLSCSKRIKKWKDFLKRVNFSGKIFEAKIVPSYLEKKLPSIQKLPVSILSQKEVFFFCGLGNPQPLLKLLKNVSASFEGKIFSDHFQYTAADEESLLDLSEGLFTITTGKDRVKLGNSKLLEKVWVLKSEIQADEFLSWLQKKLRHLQKKRAFLLRKERGDKERTLTFNNIKKKNPPI
ncbi:tetraacyldisaccharide 4'-kinase [Candidatus Riflebacteria bacterium]